MKSIKLLVAVVLVSFSTGAAAETRLTYHDNGAVASRIQYDEDGNIHGQAIYYRLSGSVASVENFEKGVQQGEAVYNFENETPERKANYEDGAMEGVQTEYFPSGNVRSEHNYRQGKADGIWRNFFDSPSKEIRTHIEHKDNQKHGKFRDYLQDGTLVRDESWVEGEATGEWKIYHPSGNIMEKYTLEHGVRDGLYTSYFDVEGELPYIEVPYEDGQYQGELKVYHVPTAAYPSLVKRLEPYVDGVIQGTVKTFYGDGVPESLVEYEDGFEHGKGEFFYPSRKKSKVQNVRYGTLHGPYSEFFDNAGNSQKIEGAYRDGLQFGPWNEWRGDGLRVSELSYVDGKLDGLASYYAAFANARLVTPLEYLAESIEYKDGLREGRYVSYVADDYYSLDEFLLNKSEPEIVQFPKKLEGEYRADKKEGVWREYNPLGELHRETPWSNDAKNGVELQYGTSRYAGVRGPRFVFMRTTYVNNGMIESLTYCPNDTDRVQSRTRYQVDSFDKEVTEYGCE